ncbi:unnamed protein product [Sphagnum tenellum]
MWLRGGVSTVWWTRSWGEREVGHTFSDNRTHNSKPIRCLHSYALYNTGTKQFATLNDIGPPRRERASDKARYIELTQVK